MAASISRGDRYIPNRELKRSTTPHAHADADGDTIRSQMSGDATDPNIAANIAAANANPTDLDGQPSFEDSISSEMGPYPLPTFQVPPDNQDGIRTRKGIPAAGGLCASPGRHLV